MNTQTMYIRSGTCQKSRGFNHDLYITETFPSTIVTIEYEGGRLCSSCNTSPTQSTRRRARSCTSRGIGHSGRRSACCRVTGRSRAGRSTVLSTSTSRRSSHSSAPTSSSATPKTSRVPSSTTPSRSRQQDPQDEPPFEVPARPFLR